MVENHFFRLFLKNLFAWIFVLSRPFPFQNLLFPMGPEATWLKMKSRKTQAKGVRTSGSKWGPGIRRPSPGRLISFKHLSPAFSGDISGLCFSMLSEGGCEVSRSFLPSALPAFQLLFLTPCYRGSASVCPSAPVSSPISHHCWQSESHLTFLFWWKKLISEWRHCIGYILRNVLLMFKAYSMMLWSGGLRELTGQHIPLPSLVPLPLLDKNSHVLLI